MNAIEFKKITALLTANWNMDFSNPLKMDLWWEKLRDVDYRLASLAIDKLINTLQFPPTIAHIREACSDIQMPKRESIDILVLVNDSIRKFGRYRVVEALEYIKQKDELAYKTVKGVGIMNLMNGDPNFYQNRIEKLYAQVVNAEKTNNMLPNDTIMQIEDFKSELRTNALMLENSEDGDW